MLKTRWTSAICTAFLWCPDEATAAGRLVGRDWDTWRWRRSGWTGSPGRRRMWRRMSWLLLHHLGDRLLGGTGPGPGPGGRQLLLRLELCGLLHGDALGRHGVIRLGHSSQGHAGAGTGCGWENKFNVQTQTKIFRKNICCSPSPDVGAQHVLLELRLLSSLDVHLGLVLVTARDA